MKSNKIEYIEVPIPAGNVKQTINFPDLPNLRGTFLNALEIFATSTHGVAESGNTLNTQAHLKNTLVVLQFQGGDYIKVPASWLFTSNLVDVAATFPAGAIAPREFNGQVINWPKSYLFFTTAANAAAVAGLSFVLNAHYTDKAK